MTVQLTYPGVYVEPIITPAPGDQGVATSLTAFVGRAMMGPVNKPVLLNNFGEYEHYFGGLDQNSTASYSLQQFFNNGGSQAYMVRCFSPDISSPEAVQSLTARGEKLIADATAQFKGKTPTKAQIDTFLTNQQAADMGINQWYLGQVKKAFDAEMVPPPAKPGGNAPPAPAPMTALRAAAPKAVPTFPAFTGLLDVNPANAAYQAIDAMMFGVGGQAALAPTNRQAVIVAGRNAVSSFTGGLTGSVSTDLIEGMATAPATSDQPAITAAVGAYAAVGASLTINVIQPVLAQVATLDTAAFTTDQNTNLTAFKAALTAFSDGTNGAEAVLKAGAAVFATDVKSQTAATVKTAMTTAAGSSNKAGIAIAAGAEGASAIDAMAGAVKAAIAFLQNNWQPFVDLRLQASSPGAWSNDVLSVSVNSTGITAAVAEQKKLDQADLFNLVVSYVTPDGRVASENHGAVTLKKIDKEGNKTGNYLPLMLSEGSLYLRVLEGADLPSEPPMDSSSAVAVGGVDSDPLEISDYIGDEDGKAGIYALKKIQIFNILCIPPDNPEGDTDNLVYSTAASFCVERNAMLIIDPPAKWTTEYHGGNLSNISLNDLGSFGAPEGRSSAVYFPRIVIEDALLNGAKRTFPASGAMAGQWSLADTSTGVWKAPAGLTSAIDGVAGLEISMSDADDGVLNPQGINCLRTFPVGGTVVWGARTMRGATALADEYRYVPVRRLLLYIMDWLEVNTRWAVFEPNDEKLWSELRLNIGSFMKGLYKDGALVGTKPDEAYFVRCDASTTTKEDQDNGIVRVQVGFAPVKPAEFVVITVQQVQQTAGA
ncbi:MAG: phage tail sheath C-terminal domain-containing protein [Sneathiella sp.]